MLGSCMHPVAILRAVFCTIYSLSMFVSDALGDHMVEAYSSTGMVMALYVSSMVSLCLPHLVEVRTPRVYYATNMCYSIYSTRVCGSICMSRSTKYIRF